MAVGVVTFGCLSFNSGPDSDGDRFTIGELDGWWAPTIDLVVVERPISDGAVVAHGRQAARAVTAVGHVSGSTIQNAMRAARKLEAAIAALIGADGTLTVDEGSATYTLTVRAQGLRSRRAGPYGFEFEVDLVAANPAKSTV
jgi:hypothetical protein